MWGKFFAFAMLVLIVLVIIQFSSLSDEDVAKIKARIEEQKKEKSEPQETVVPTETSAVRQVTSSAKTSNDPIQSEPAVIEYEAFLNAVPKMKFDSEMNGYLTPEAVEDFRQRLTGFSSDPLEVFKLMHDLQDMEYMEFSYIDNQTAVITYIASGGLIRKMGQVVNEGMDQKTLELYEVVMKNNADQWLVHNEVSQPINNPAFDVELKEKYKPLLDKYHAKRQARAQ